MTAPSSVDGQLREIALGHDHNLPGATRAENATAPATSWTTLSRTARGTPRRRRGQGRRGAWRDEGYGGTVSSFTRTVTLSPASTKPSAQLAELPHALRIRSTRIGIDPGQSSHLRGSLSRNQVSGPINGIQVKWTNLWRSGHARRSIGEPGLWLHDACLPLRVSLFLRHSDSASPTPSRAIPTLRLSARLGDGGQDCVAPARISMRATNLRSGNMESDDKGSAHHRVGEV